MRLLIDTLVALTLVCVLGGIALHSHREKQLDRRLDLAHNELRRLQSQIMLQCAMAEAPLTKRGYPAMIDPAWFGDKVPVNVLLEAGHASFEIADESQAEQDHPGARVATKDHAQFWYNPYKGVVRARVPGNVSETTALRLYNRVNDCNLSSLTP